MATSTNGELDLKKLMPLKIVFLGDQKELITAHYDAHLFPVPRKDEYIEVWNDKMRIQGIVAHVQWRFDFETKTRPEKRACVMLFLRSVKITPFDQHNEQDSEDRGSGNSS